MTGFAVRLAALMARRGMGVRALARQVPCNHALISRYLNGHQAVSPGMAARLDGLLGAGGELVALACPAQAGAGAGEEVAAVDLARLVTASDVGAATVERVEHAVDDLAVAYPGTTPSVLLARTRAHLGYVTALLERRCTLAEHARLLVAAGWLSLLAAASLIDLHRRAWARLGAAPDTREALARTEALVSALPQPDQPEHHYKYDPAKADSYVATTLSWAGDPAAVDTARQVLAQMESSADALPRPRRAALARLDLALALANTGQGDEAAAVAMEALTSGLIVQSSFWRAAEVIDAVDSHGAPGAADLREAYQEFCQPSALPPGAS